MAISFSFSVDEYEEAACDRRLLVGATGGPPLAVRLALVAGQIFTYVAAGQVVLGAAESTLLLELFDRHSNRCSESYVSAVEDLAPVRTLAVQKQQSERLF